MYEEYLASIRAQQLSAVFLCPEYREFRGATASKRERA
jgi:hypothetical protein